jgi:Mor family transcriptional regulator
LVSVIEQEARAVAASFGVSVPDDAAAALVQRLLIRLGGERLYLPRRRAALQRHEEIRARYTGGNVADLAREFGLTTRSVRRIVNA